MAKRRGDPPSGDEAVKRREFPQSCKKDMVKRATKAGVVYCEMCGDPIKPGRWEYHHTIEEELVVDKSARLTADDGLLICEPCHADVTATQSIPRIAEAKRREARHLGVKKVSPRGFPKAKKERPALRVAEGRPALMRMGFVPATEV